MADPHRIHRYTYADYVALEKLSLTKHEFLDGEIYAMAGGSEEHSALAAEMLRLLGNAVGNGPCRVHTLDLRVYVETPGLATFPDCSVICGPLQQHFVDSLGCERFQGSIEVPLFPPCARTEVAWTRDGDEKRGDL